MRPLIVFLLAGLLSAADEWPQFRGNPQLTGVASSAVPSIPKLLWTYEAGDSIESSAAIVGGTVYVGVQSADLLAIDLETGRLRWKYRAKDGIGESSPAVHDGVVYIGDLAGLLHAVRAADGKALWTFKTEGEIKSSPVVAGNRVLIGSYDGKLYCLSARDGKLLWKFTTSNYVHATPVISGGIVYLAGCDEVFRGIRIADAEFASRTERKYSNSPPADTQARPPRCWPSGCTTARLTMRCWAWSCTGSELSGVMNTPSGISRFTPRRLQWLTAS